MQIIEFLASVGAKMQHRPPKSAMNILPDTLELDVDDQNKPIMPLLSLRSVSKSQLSGSQGVAAREMACSIPRQPIPYFLPNYQMPSKCCLPAHLMHAILA